MQGCLSGTLMTNNAKQPSYTLRRDFLPGYEFAELQEQLLHRRPLMLPHHLEQGLNAVNINFNLQGLDLYPASSRVRCSQVGTHGLTSSCAC